MKRIKLPFPVFTLRNSMGTSNQYFVVELADIVSKGDLEFDLTSQTPFRVFLNDGFNFSKPTDLALMEVEDEANHTSESN